MPVRTTWIYNPHLTMQSVAMSDRYTASTNIELFWVEIPASK